MANNEEEKNNVHREENEPKQTESIEEGGKVEDSSHEKLEDLEELLKEKDSEIFDLKMENIKLKEKLRKDSEIYEREIKRRLLKEKIDIFKEFLEVLDNIERAFESFNSDENSEHFRGIKLIQEQLKKFLSSYGVKEIEVMNEPYNPNIADIGEVVYTNDYPPNTVVKVLRKGYYIGDDVLRTAVVSVAMPEEHRNKENNNSTN